MAVLKKIKRALRGDVRLTTVALEAIRRTRVSRQIRKERASFAKNADKLAATPVFRLSDEELLRSVREDRGGKFFSRPVIRPFITYAEWSDDFRGLVGGTAYEHKTDGLSYGIQAEAWW